MKQGEIMCDAVELIRAVFPSTSYNKHINAIQVRHHGRVFSVRMRRFKGCRFRGLRRIIAKDVLGAVVHQIVERKNERMVQGKRRQARRRRLGGR